MSIYRKIEQNVRELEKSYPEGLAARLEWWCAALGIDRVRLLRMIGMSARQAARRKDDDLNEILKRREWADHALGLVELLGRLLSLYHHDLRAVAENIRRASMTRREETSQAARPRSGIKRPQARRNGKLSEILLDRIHQGGSQALTSLYGYLIESQAEAGRTES
jgi:hypothetical protein